MVACCDLCTDVVSDCCAQCKTGPRASCTMHVRASCTMHVHVCLQREWAPARCRLSTKSDFSRCSKTAAKWMGQVPASRLCSSRFKRWGAWGGGGGRGRGWGKGYLCKENGAQMACHLLSMCFTVQSSGWCGARSEQPSYASLCWSQRQVWGRLSRYRVQRVTLDMEEQMLCCREAIGSLGVSMESMGLKNSAPISIICKVQAHTIPAGCLHLQGCSPAHSP